MSTKSSAHAKSPAGEWTLEPRDWHQRWSDRAVAFFALVIPLFVLVGAKDTFRVPKDALFRAEPVILACLYLAALIVQGRIRRGGGCPATVSR